MWIDQVLMLVLRDVEEDGHFEALDEAARANMEALWRDVDKPSRSASRPNDGPFCPAGDISSVDWVGW